MNLALQKRNEQLERWRQHEASVELLQQQQQKQTNTTTGPSKTKHINFSIQTASRRGTRASNDNDNNSIDNSLIVGSRKRATSQSNIKGKSKVDLHVNFSYPTLFLTACASGDLAECERLLDESLINIDVTTSEGLTGLHQAAICGNVQMVEFLINRGANINCCDNEGWTPLHAASSLGIAPIVQMLLDFGADATIVNCENLLAYDLARDDQVRSLIAENLKDIDIDFLRNQEERAIEMDIERWIRTGNYEERSHPQTNATVLHVIAAKGYVHLMKRILETPSLKKQINLEAKDYEGFTPLLAGSFWSQSEIVELLIEHGANIFAQANNGYKISSIVSIAVSFFFFYLIDEIDQ